jgi:hypothetical protein
MSINDDKAKEFLAALVCKRCQRYRLEKIDHLLQPSIVVYSQSDASNHKVPHCAHAVPIYPVKRTSAPIQQSMRTGAL